MNKNEITKENKIIMGAAVVIAAVIIIFAVVNTKSTSTTATYTNTPSKYDVFAQCLAKAGATMYGASWCPHCQALKATFGNSFQYVKYVECPENIVALIRELTAIRHGFWAQRLIDVGFAGDATMQLLASSTGCVLPQ